MPRKMNEWRISDTGDVAVYCDARREVELEIDARGLDVRVEDEVLGRVPTLVIPIETLRALLASAPARAVRFCEGGCGTPESALSIESTRHDRALCENCVWEHDHGEEDCGWRCEETPAALREKHAKGKCSTFCPNPGADR